MMRTAEIAIFYIGRWDYRTAFFMKYDEYRRPEYRRRLKSGSEKRWNVFLLSVRRLLYLIFSDVIKGMQADCNSLWGHTVRRLRRAVWSETPAISVHCSKSQRSYLRFAWMFAEDVYAYCFDNNRMNMLHCILQTRLFDVCAARNFALTRSLRDTRTAENFFGSCTLLEASLQVPAKLFIGVWYENY